MLLLTYIQKLPDANQAGLEKYLFGQATTLLASDVWMISMVTAICLLIILSFWKAFKLVLFDEEYAKTLGVKTRLVNGAVTAFIVLAIVLGLQSVGVVLMSSMLLAPAAAARQWTNSLKVMFLLAAFFGASSGVVGTAISASSSHLSTGPVIVLVATVFVFFSFVFSPFRGILMEKLRRFRNRQTLEVHKTLAFMFDIASSHDDYKHPHEIKILNGFQGFSKKSLQQLVDNGQVTLEGSRWALTDKGYEDARQMYDQMLIKNREDV